MFRKLVGNLSFSPSMVGEVAKYAKFLKRQKKLQLISIILLTVALLLQIVGFYVSGKKTPSVHESNLIYGGISSRQDFIKRYSKNDLSIRGLLSSIGISSSDINNISNASLTAHTKPYAYHIARTPTPGHSQSYYIIPGSEANLFVSDVNPDLAIEPSLSGYSDSVGNFTILLSSGDLLVQKLPKNAYPLYKDNIVINTTITNNTSHNLNDVKPNTLLIYTIEAKNTSDKGVEFYTSTYIGDLTEYADIVDISGGMLDDNKTTINWVRQDLEPDKNTTHTFTVRTKPNTPTTSQNPALPYSYDCNMDIIAPGAQTVRIDCPIIKKTELYLHKLPRLSANIIFFTTLTLLLLAVISYLRTHLYYEEIRLVRHGINKGTLL